MVFGVIVVGDIYRGVAGITMTEVQSNIMRESPRGKLGWGYVEVIYTKIGQDLLPSKIYLHVLDLVLTILVTIVYKKRRSNRKLNNIC